MRVQEAMANIGIGPIAGCVGTKAMEPVSMKLYGWESEEDRQREDQVRPDPPYQIAAQKIPRLASLEPSGA